MIKIDTEVLFVSTDSKYSHKEFSSFSREDGGISPILYPLISDVSWSISERFFCLNKEQGCCYNALFIINDEGNLKHMTIGISEIYNDIDQTVRLIQAFQFSNKYSVVCQSKWNPGRKGVRRILFIKD